MRPALSLESCRSVPGHLTYLDRGLIFVELRNNEDDLLDVRGVTCGFQTERGLPPYQVTIPVQQEIAPHGLSPAPLQVPFTASLSLTQYTNTYEIKVDYLLSGVRQTQTLAPGGYLMIEPVRPPEKHFFVSHKDPEETGTGQRLDYFLQKIGFGGFLAEDHKRPGLDIWNDKIVPAIDACVAMIVLWTADAVRDPTNILRELDCARRAGRKTILVVENGSPLPSGFPSDIEYQRTPATIDDAALIELVESIHETYRLGGY